MMEAKIPIRINILSKDVRFGRWLTTYLKLKFLGKDIDFRTYTDIDKCFETMSYVETNFLVVNYDDKLAPEFQERVNEFRSLVMNEDIIVRVPEEHKGKKIEFMKDGESEFVVYGPNTFNKVYSLLKSLMNIEEVRQRFRVFNYALAALLLVVTIVFLIIYF